MRLVIATPLYPPDIGGPATYTKLLEEGLPTHGIEVKVVKFSDVRNLPKLVRHVAYYNKVLKAAQNADAVLALDPVSVGLPAMKAAKKAGKPFFVKIVGDYAWEQGTQRFGVTATLDGFVRTSQVPLGVAILRKTQKEVAEGAVHVIVPSDYLKDIVCAWGISREKVQVINNAITVPEQIPSYQKGKGEFLIVSAGRRVPWKGFEAIERLGQTHQEDGWRVEIVSGKPREEVFGWMKVADVFVLNSTYEGFPHALIEAMTLGTPVIAADNRGNIPLLDKGRAGLLVPQGDDIALERALMDVWKNPTAARERANVARERMSAYEVSTMLENTARFLKENI